MNTAPIHTAGPSSARLTWTWVLAGVCLALAGLLPVMVAWQVLSPWPQGLLTAFSQATGSSPIHFEALRGHEWRLFVVAAMAMLPVLCMAYALVQASRCLRMFARGQYFAQSAVGALRWFAALVFAAGVAGTLVPSLSGWMLSSIGTGTYSLALSFSSHQLFLLLFSGLTWQIASVLTRAVALADEHAQIV